MAVQGRLDRKTQGEMTNIKRERERERERDFWLAAAKCGHATLLSEMKQKKKKRKKMKLNGTLTVKLSHKAKQLPHFSE